MATMGSPQDREFWARELRDMMFRVEQSAGEVGSIEAMVTLLQDAETLGVRLQAEAAHACYRCGRWVVGKRGPVSPCTGCGWAIAPDGSNPDPDTPDRESSDRGAE